ncbi:MAG: histidine kinase [Mucilaginibacter polytrichastri]|nr:histidine kinase [Mucilaginibacter polytrichastri]
MQKKRNPGYIITTLHILFWLVIIILPYSMRLAENPAGTAFRFPARFIWSNSLLVIVFYLHAYVLFPLQNRRLGYGIYAASLMGVVVLFLAASFWMETVFPPPPRPNDRVEMRRRDPQFDREMRKRNSFRRFNPGFFLLPFFSTLALSYCYRLLIDNAKREQHIHERENLHLRTELGLLRSQVSPHFMFNVLNNLVALARKKSDQIEPSLIQLSGLMRYMLYETDDNRIALSTEVDYLKSYIELQMLRFDEVQLDLRLPENMHHLRIEPMLLIPFVENAFKHGIGMLNQPVIRVELEIPQIPTAVFTVQNPVPPGVQNKDRSSGIGLANIRRRLALLYPDRHELIISRQHEQFTTRLTLQLSDS